MDILTISGSPHRSSSNAKMLEGLSQLNGSKSHNFIDSLGLIDLPLFTPDIDHSPWPKMVESWRTQVDRADALIISTPAYLKNIPAVLKNGLEWLTTSGELQGKPTLALTYTPHPPRGEDAMKSLLFSLGALDARIVAQCPLYQNELTIQKDGTLIGKESIELLEEAIALLI